MTGKTSPALIVLVSVLFSVGLSYVLRGSSTPDRATSPVRSMDDDGLEARVARLEALLEERSFEKPGPPIERALVRTSNSAGRAELAFDPLAERLQQLERRIAELALAGGDSGPSPAEQELLQLERKQDLEQTVQDALKTLADPTATVADKVAAHEALRRVPDAYSPEMIDDLVYIATSDPDPRVRSDVWRNFDGATHIPSLVPHLLRALGSDSDPLTRSEAAETLGNYAEDEAVLAALRKAFEDEDSVLVKRKLSRTLSEWTPWVAGNR